VFERELVVFDGELTCASLGELLEAGARDVLVPDLDDCPAAF
jgi:hypothetical protein